MNLSSSFIAKLETYGLNKYNICIQNLENTTYENEMFDYITSLSVIEHGINIEKYFKEMNRLLKKEGLLLTSTDFWEEKLDTSNSCSFGLPDIIFSLEEMKEVLNIAEKNGFELIEPMDFSCKEKFVTGFHKDVDYTFLFFGFKKIKSLY
jgi:ubiquinone/menaquinone biosynthesis C-methylase UbiE